MFKTLVKSLLSDFEGLLTRPSNRHLSVNNTEYLHSFALLTAETMTTHVDSSQIVFR